VYIVPLRQKPWQQFIVNGLGLFRNALDLLRNVQANKGFWLNKFTKRCDFLYMRLRKIIYCHDLKRHDCHFVHDGHDLGRDEQGLEHHALGLVSHEQEKI